MKESQIILVFGRICSGKSTFQSQAYRVVVSNIVRKLINSNDRSQLQNTQHLDEQIAQRILGRIETYQMLMANDVIKTHNIIIDGIRQPSIVSRVLEQYPQSTLVWLEVPADKRKMRYELRADIKDVEPFEIADNKPIELEGQNIFSIFEERLQIINNH
jgi:hypothetical protein